MHPGTISDRQNEPNRQFQNLDFSDFEWLSGQNGTWLDHFPGEHLHKIFFLGSLKHGHSPKKILGIDSAGPRPIQTFKQPSKRYIYLYEDHIVKVGRSAIFKGVWDVTPCDLEL